MSDILTESIRQAVRKPEVIEALCRSLEVQLRAQLGGADFYVGKRTDRVERDERIRAAFTGGNYQAIASAESLTPRQVRRIVHKQADKK